MFRVLGMYNFGLDHFLDARAEIGELFAGFLALCEYLRKLFSYEISWPLKSAGDMARQKQTKEALGEVVDANESETVVDGVKVR